MAKSAKDKLAVDGTPKLAAKSKSSDKHEKKNLSIEEATVESPRQSRKRAGDFFDFGDEADRVADDLTGDSAKQAGKASVSKASKPSKKAKIDAAEAPAKKDGKKGKPDKDESLEDRVVAEDAKKSKGKRADKAAQDVVVGPSGDTAAVPGGAPETANKAKKGKGKKADKVAEAAAEATKPKGTKTDTVKGGAADAKSKKADAGKKTADDGKTLEDRVVADDAKKQKDDVKKQKSKKADDSKKDIVVGPSGDTATVSKAVPEEANKAKKGKTAKDGATAKTTADGTKPSKKDSNASKNVKADPAQPKETTKKAEPKEKVVKSKAAKESASTDPKTSTKKSKAQASTGATPEGSKSTQVSDAVNKGKPPVDEGKAPKPPKVKTDTKKPTKEVAAGKTTKKAKDGEAANPKKATTAKDNKPGIPDQAVQPKDLVEEETALHELSKPEPSKGKKRKAPSDVAADTVKSNLLDPLAEHAADESAKKKQKKSRKSLGETLGDIVATGADAVRNSFTGILGGGGADGKPTTTGSSHKQSKGKGKATDADDIQPTANEANDEEDEEDDAPDDQTAALLAGFESDGDDVHTPGDTGFKEGNKIPSLPNSTATSKKLKAIGATETHKPGVIYVGRIPHGFYEHEMRTYFSQFGDINRLRLSRSVKTGRSKHYAFLEFKSEDVAKIVAETMDNYLMFGHILKCKVVAPGDVHETMWKGANKRFKKVPWNKIEGRKLEMPVGRDVWKKREEKETKKRAEKSKKTLQKVGYAFEGTGLKSVDSVPKRIVAAATEQERSLITSGGEEQAGPVVVSEEVTSVKIKKGEKVATEAAKATVSKAGKRALEDGEAAVASVTKRAKKAKKDVKA